MKVKSLSPLLALVLLAMGFALAQLTNVEVQAEAGVCCSTAQDCPATQICTRPGNSAPCCDPAQHPGCKGTSYCRDNFGD